MVVIACGTISSNIYSKIKDKYGMTLIDVLTPTIKYITDNKLTDIGVLGTPMTIQSGYFSEIAKSEVACPLLVPLIENGKKDTKECEEIVIDYLKRLHNPKNIILGCTHYPILSDIIKKHSKAKLINMGKCVSQYLNLTNIGIPKVTLYFSKIDETLKDNVYSILKQNYEIQEKII